MSANYYSAMSISNLDVHVSMQDQCYELNNYVANTVQYTCIWTSQCIYSRYIYLKANGIIKGWFKRMITRWIFLLPELLPELVRFIDTHLTPDSNMKHHLQLLCIFSCTWQQHGRCQCTHYINKKFGFQFKWHNLAFIWTDEHAVYSIGLCRPWQLLKHIFVLAI